MIIAVIIYLILSIAVAYWGKHRTIGFVNTLVVCVLLSPITGILVVFNSSKLIMYHVVQHECPECGYCFDEKHDFCPLCVKEGKFIMLNPTIVPTT